MPLSLSFWCYLIFVKIRLGVVGAPAQPLGCRYVVRGPTVAVTPSAEGCGAYLWGSYLTVAWGVSGAPQRPAVYPSHPRPAVGGVRPALGGIYTVLTHRHISAQPDLPTGVGEPHSRLPLWGFAGPPLLTQRLISVAATHTNAGSLVIPSALFRFGYLSPRGLGYDHRRRGFPMLNLVSVVLFVTCAFRQVGRYV
jgi:hypothetical protein